MPYRWTESSDQTDLTLWPHRSLPRRGFAAMILITFFLIILPLFTLLGTILLWGMLPFLLGAVAALWWGLERSYRDGDIRERLILTPTQVQLTHIRRKSAPLTWDCNAYWARSNLHETGGRLPNYVTLSGNGREVEIGAFLTEDERISLYNELTRALDRHRNTAKDPQ
jgi:uncharacterized membrane protein